MNVLTSLNNRYGFYSVLENFLTWRSCRTKLYHLDLWDIHLIGGHTILSPWIVRRSPEPCIFQTESYWVCPQGPLQPANIQITDQGPRTSRTLNDISLCGLSNEYEFFEECHIGALDPVFIECFEMSVLSKSPSSSENKFTFCQSNDFKFDSFAWPRKHFFQGFG